MRRTSALLGLLLGSSASHAATKLPPGFAEEVVVEGVNAVTTMDWGPDGELWVGGRLGDVWVWRSDRLVPVARLPVDTRGEHGLVGLAVDPDHSVNAHIWIFYTTLGPPSRNRLSRFRVVGDQLVDETVILETEDLAGDVHTGGCLRFAPDGTLYVATGDDLQGSDTAQNPFDLRGKILHIQRDGTPAPDNPYLDGRDGDPRVWALGFRNPWRFSIQPESENLFIGDVGGDRYEELNIGIPGGNYGWSEAEGPEPRGLPGFIYPIYSYPHTSELGHAIIAGGHAPALDFPDELEGDYFFADQVTREIYRMDLDEANQPISTEIFASDTSGGPVELRFGPDGALYYMAYERMRLYRIYYVGAANRPPVAVVSLSRDSGRAPLHVNFDASRSVDPDGDPLSFRWDFGDGTASVGVSVDKSYPAGVHYATLTVTDARGASSRAERIRIVSGNEAPAAIIQEPNPSRRYHEGEIIVFEGIAVDPEEGLLPCERLTWNVIFHHLGHTHPFLGPLEGVCGSQFRIDSHGVESTFYEIRLSARDEGRPLGAEGSVKAVQSIEIHPR